MAKYKRYPEGEVDIFCPIGYTIDNILGKKWSVYIIREMANGPKNFNQILKSLTWGLTAKTLSARLKDLEKEKIVRKKILKNKIPNNVQYSLTERGTEFVKAFRTLEKWSKKWNIRFE